MKKLYKRIGKLVKGNGRDDEGAWQTSLNYQEILGVLSKLGVELEELSQEQAEYIGVTPEGPYKPVYYRY